MMISNFYVTLLRNIHILLNQCVINISPEINKLSLICCISIENSRVKLVKHTI